MNLILREEFGQPVRIDVQLNISVLFNSITFLFSNAAQSNDLPKVLELIMKGVDVNSTDRNGYTALHYASRNGHFELCKLLLSHKADVNLLTKAGRASSLHR